ncbi:DUF1573 domain-containing protein [bacterium]|nr:DUF1573 domain-containing protein [bacterium]
MKFRRPFIIIAGALALSCSGEPKLSVEEPIYTAGQLAPRERKTVWFKLSNEGDKELVIENIRSLCDCIVVEQAPETIQPQSSDSLKVVYTAPDSAGPDESYLMLRTNSDPKNMKLGIKSTVLEVKLTREDSSIVIFPFQVSGLADGQKFSLDIFQYLIEHVPPGYTAKNPNEMTNKFRDDPAFEKEPLNDVARKWSNLLGIRFVVLGDARPSVTGEGLDLSIMLVDGTFRLPIGKRITGIEMENAFKATSDTIAYILSNLGELEKQAFIADLQRKWAEQRAAMIGKPAPPLAAENIISGKTIGIDNFKGSPLIIQFFSSDCDHCEEEMEWLKGLIQEHSDIAALGVSVDVGEIDSVKNFIKGKELNYPVILPTEENEKQLDPYYGGATPQTVIISPEGIVVEYFMGANSRTYAKFEKLLIGMLADKQ